MHCFNFKLIDIKHYLNLGVNKTHNITDCPVALFDYIDTFQKQYPEVSCLARDLREV